MGFADQWLWLIFIGVGVALVALEFLVGIETGFELVSIGAAFILGGVIAWPFDLWMVAVITTGILCLAYVSVGRKYIRRWVQVRRTPTNVDAIIGRGALSSGAYLSTPRVVFEWVRRSGGRAPEKRLKKGRR